MERELIENDHPAAIMSRRLPFFDPFPEEMHNSELNPFVRKYFDHGEPVVVGRDATQFKGAWDACFHREAPLCLEIGSGNGFFLEGMAQKYPDRNWLGVEIRYKRVIMVAKKLEVSGIDNARILRYDNWCLDDLFEEASLAGVYCNHPDPWSKKRQAHKRILSKPFARWMAWAMQDGAEWRIKTDFETHIDTMLGVIEDLPFTVMGVARDAHNTSFPWSVDEDVTTNYERKFIERDLPIYALRLKRNERDN
jgi:tRNA (guanine-N7-)-methyltransferase